MKRVVDPLIHRSGALRRGLLDPSSLFSVVATASVLLLAGCGESSQAGPGPALVAEFAPGVTYTNEHIATGPWSIHVVRARRDSGEFGLVSVHAKRSALGLSTLSQQVRSVPAALGIPVAAVNGDFYQRDRAYAGDPRGLQIVEGELISAPIGGVALWIDVAGQPHATNIQPQLEVSWAPGASQAIGLNEDRQPNEVVLYTPSIGSSTRTSGGREWVLKPADTNSPMARIGFSGPMTVAEVKDGGSSPVLSGAWVLSAGQSVLRKNPGLAALGVGARLDIRLGSVPDLSGATQAISGGPVLVRGGKALKIVPPRSDSYEFSSMVERHPRSAVGWSRTHFILVEVDGRQNGLSVGMTLEELGATLLRWGAEEGINLDGGGSATFWCNGQIQNSPCDGGERAIANSLVLVRKTAARP